MDSASDRAPFIPPTYAKPQQLTDDAGALVAHGDPKTALFEFFTRLVERTTSNRTVVSLLAAEGIDVPITGALGSLTSAVQELLQRGPARPA